MVLKMILSTNMPSKSAIGMSTILLKVGIDNFVSVGCAKRGFRIFSRNCWESKASQKTNGADYVLMLDSQTPLFLSCNCDSWISWGMSFDS